jgi:hypothetical protein
LRVEVGGETGNRKGWLVSDGKQPSEDGMRVWDGAAGRRVERAGRTGGGPGAGEVTHKVKRGHLTFGTSGRLLEQEVEGGHETDTRMRTGVFGHEGRSNMMDEAAQGTARHVTARRGNALDARGEETI